MKYRREGEGRKQGRKNRDSDMGGTGRRESIRRWSIGQKKREGRKESDGNKGRRELS